MEIHIGSLPCFQEVTKEVVTTQELGGAVVHTKKSGTCVAAPGRNQTLFRCVFRSHYCVRSTVTQNFC